jgi:hypothetical protein
MRQQVSGASAFQLTKRGQPRRQGNLGRQIGSNWSAATKADMFGGAWILSGTYSNDMKSFSQTTAMFYQGSSEVASDAGLIEAAWQQMQSAPTTGNGRISLEEWQIFQVDVVQLATFCNVPGKRALASPDPCQNVSATTVVEEY